MVDALEQRERERLNASKKLQVLSHRLVEVQESERRHIARELHDEIGQALTAAEMNLQAALQAPRAPNLERRLTASMQAVEQVLEQVHDLSLNLRPSILDDLGLEPALRWLTRRQAELAGVEAEFHADHLEHRLQPLIETECFRVAQEALTNVLKHARARSISVHLTRTNSQLHVRVCDDGVGFDVGRQRSDAVQGASLGLLSMEERAALAGGSLELHSEAGQGTEVHAWFPLRWRDEGIAEVVEHKENKGKLGTG
jgi:signal transduction histidine kinase